MSTTLVIGASNNPIRYSYKAIQNLRAKNYSVIALGVKNGFVGDVEIVTNFPSDAKIDTITLYINPDLQTQYFDLILSLQPKRVIFNPGTENEVLMGLLQKNNITCMEACTLVLLSIGAY